MLENFSKPYRYILLIVRGVVLAYRYQQADFSVARIACSTLGIVGSCVMHSLGVADRDPEETLFYFEHARAR